MFDLPNLDAARAALAARKRGRWDDIALTDALAAVDALTAELAALKEREGRLTDILAAERGERAPEGWRWEDGEWSRGELSVVPGPTGTGWFWGRTRRGSFYAEVHHAYALEAIEAADRAVTEVPRG